MDKSELKFLIVIALFVTVAIVNSFYLWLPASAPIVILVIGVALYSLWEHKHGNKT